MTRLLLLTVMVSALRPREDARTVWDEEEDARMVAIEEAGLLDEDIEAGSATPADPPEPGEE